MGAKSHDCLHTGGFPNSILCYLRKRPDIVFFVVLSLVSDLICTVHETTTNTTADGRVASICIHVLYFVLFGPKRQVPVDHNRAYTFGCPQILWLHRI